MGLLELPAVGDVLWQANIAVGSEVIRIERFVVLRIRARDARIYLEDKNGNTRMMWLSDEPRLYSTQVAALQSLADETQEMIEEIRALMAERQRRCDESMAELRMQAGKIAEAIERSAFADALQ